MEGPRLHSPLALKSIRHENSWKVSHSQQRAQPTGANATPGQVVLCCRRKQVEQAIESKSSAFFRGLHSTYCPDFLSRWAVNCRMTSSLSSPGWFQYHICYSNRKELEHWYLRLKSRHLNHKNKDLWYTWAVFLNDLSQLGATSGHAQNT